jgi:hypothetical protein
MSARAGSVVDPLALELRRVLTAVNSAGPAAGHTNGTDL